MGQAAEGKTKGLTLGALGGPHTFNARAAKAMCERYPQFAEIVYLPTSEEVVLAALRGEVDAACAPEQTSKTGFHAGMLARMAGPESKLYVIAETARRYGCSLLGKPGASLARLRRVFGHDGSIAHSRAWLERNVAGAEIEVVDTHSGVAARIVLDGDGSIASVGAPDLAAAYGLVELAREIDDGSAVNYWAVSLRPLFPARTDASAGRRALRRRHAHERIDLRACGHGLSATWRVPEGDRPRALRIRLPAPVPRERKAGRGA